MCDIAERSRLLAVVQISIVNATKAGIPADVVAKAAAAQLDDTTDVKVRVANEFRREGYMLALERVVTDLRLWDSDHPGLEPTP